MNINDIDTKEQKKTTYHILVCRCCRIGIEFSINLNSEEQMDNAIYKIKLMPPEKTGNNIQIPYNFTFEKNLNDNILSCTNFCITIPINALEKFKEVGIQKCVFYIGLNEKTSSGLSYSIYESPPSNDKLSHVNHIGIQSPCETQVIYINDILNINDLEISSQD